MTPLAQQLSALIEAQGAETPGHLKLLKAFLRKFHRLPIEEAQALAAEVNNPEIFPVNLRESALDTIHAAEPRRAEPRRARRYMRSVT